MISKEIVWETEHRLLNSKNNSLRVLEEVLIDIKNANPTVFIDEQTAEVHLAVDTFHIFNSTKKEIFNSIISAQSYFLGKKYFYEARASRLKLIKKYIERQSGKIANRINNLRRAFILVHTAVWAETDEDDSTPVHLLSGRPWNKCSPLS